jgi:hypothetical protein
MLEGPIAETPGSCESDDRLRAILILELLNRGLWPVWRAALHAPARAFGMLDHRAYLLSEIERRMTVEDARHLLPDFQELLERHAKKQGHDTPGLIDHALSLVRDQQHLSPGDVGILEGLVLQLLDVQSSFFHLYSIIERLKSVPTSRPRLYSFYAERALRGDSSGALCHRSIISDDWEWLEQKARGPWSDLPNVWQDVFLLAEGARGRGDINNSRWFGLLAEIELQSPGLVIGIEESRRKMEEEKKQWEERLGKEKTPEPEDHPLPDVVRQILGRADYSPDDRMRVLSSVCFYELQPPNITGTWEDLSEDLKAKVLSACREGLELGQPSPLLNGEGVSTATVLEGIAFERLIRTDGTSEWFTGDLILRWLPSAIKGLLSSGWTDMIRACWLISKTATAQVLKDTIASQSRRNPEPSKLWSIPTECWSEELIEALVELIGDEQLQAHARGDLLELLATLNFDQALPFAEIWAYEAVSGLPEDQLRQAGRNVLLCRKPEKVIDMIEQELNQRKSSCVDELYALSGGRHRLNADWGRWPAELLERFAIILFKVYPLDDLIEGGSVVHGMDIRMFMSGIIGALLKNPSPEFAAAVDRLMEIDRVFKQITLRERATSEAKHVISETASNAFGDPSALPLETARWLLDRADFRLIRSSDDLLDAILFALERVQREVGHDLPMLYGRSRRGRQQSRTESSSSPGREPLNEDALQAYLRRRLKDELSKVTGEVEVDFAREEQVGFRRRFDLKVTAPCQGTRQLAKVVVELKWSTNPETKTALIEQLGKKYLLQEQLSHGIYVVGWSGWWQPGHRCPKSYDQNELANLLFNQRDSFCTSGQLGNGLRIEPRVLDLSWNPS